MNKHTQSQQTYILTIMVLVLSAVLGDFTKLASAANSVENSNWEIFFSKNSISALALSADEKTLWVSNEAGIEQRNIETGKVRLWTDSDGLPPDQISGLVNDGNGGLWIGLWESGLVHLQNDKLKWFNSDNSDLPGHGVDTLMSDGEGGVWLGSWGKLVHLDKQDTWTIFDIGQSGLLEVTQITALANDDNDGLWIGFDTGLAHFNHGEWEIVDSQNLDLPNNLIKALISDDDHGVWIGTEKGGIAHLNSMGGWSFFNTGNSDLSNNHIKALSIDSHGGLWIGTTTELNYFSIEGEWKIFKTDNDNSDSPDKKVAAIVNDITALVNDSHGGLWIGTFSGDLAHLKDGTEWQIFNKSGLPYSPIFELVNDGNHGLWIGTLDGLAYLDAQNHNWLNFHTFNSELPDNNINALVTDDNGGVWIGTDNGLAHLNNDKEKWTIFNTDNSELPNNIVNTLANDGNGGLWIGMWNTSTLLSSEDLLENRFDYISGLAHRNSSGEWTFFNTFNSDLPDNQIHSLSSDGDGGVWVGTNGKRKLSHLNKNGEWQIFDAKKLSLLSNVIYSITNDGNGGVWIGTSGSGIGHFSNDEWKVFNTYNSDLPDNFIETIISDNNSGVWMGMINYQIEENKEFDYQPEKGKGLAHLNSNGKLTIFNSNNSGLPYNDVTSLANDGKGGIWVGTSYAALAHLTFSQKYNLCANVPNMIDEQCNKLHTNSRSAILIHPHGVGKGGFGQANNMALVATYAYQTLFNRGYDHEDIYFLSSIFELDFNGDEKPDYIVDAPITFSDFLNNKTPRDIMVADIEMAFTWAIEKSQAAKEQGLAEQPLIVSFVGHGLPDQLILNPLGNISLHKATLKGLLDDYQTQTDNNAVVVILEASHSGTLVETLKAPNRLIISSTNEGLSYYSDLGVTSFTKFYFDQLYRGANYGDALQFVTNKLAQLRYPLNQQVPQLRTLSDDSQMLQTQCLNGCFGSLPNEPVLTPDIPANKIVSLDSSLELTVHVEDNNDVVKKVLVYVITPMDAQQRNEQGFVGFNYISLKELTKADNKWRIHFSDFTARGEYNFLFKIVYPVYGGTRIVNALQPVTVCVESCQTPAFFNVNTNTLHLPAVSVPDNSGGTNMYQARLLLLSTKSNILLELDQSSLKLVSDTTLLEQAHFEPSTGIVQIPTVDILNESNRVDTFSAELQLLPESSPLQFTLERITQQ